MFIAHRGLNNHKYGENCMDGILDSLDKNYISGIECDLRLTRDNKIVLLHNMLIDRVSNASGFVYKKNLDDLLSYQFHSGKITVLSDLLSKINNNKILLLEIKEERNVISEWVVAIESILKNYSDLNIYLCSFNYNLLKNLKNRFKNIKMGLIVGYSMNKSKDLSLFDFVMYHYNSFKYTHKMSMVFTINDFSLKEKYKKRVDYIITDVAYKLV